MQTASIVRFNCCIVVNDLSKNRLLAYPDVLVEEQRDFLVEEDGGANQIYGAEGDSIVPPLKFGKKVLYGVVVIEPVDGEPHL